MERRDDGEGVRIGGKRTGVKRCSVRKKRPIQVERYASFALIC